MSAQHPNAAAAAEAAPGLRTLLADALRGEGEAWLFVLRTLLSIYLAGWVALRLDLASPMTAMITVVVVMHRQTGMVFAKGFYRVLGTLIGSVAALTMVALFPQEPVLFVLALSLWIGACTGGALLYRNFKAYAFVLSGYTVALIALPAVNQPQNVFNLVVARVTEVVLGLLVTGIVSDVVFPSRLRQTLRDTVRRASDGFLDFVRDATGGQLPREAMEQAHLRFVRDAVTIEDLRSSVVFEDPEARVRSGRLRLLNQRFMAVSTSFQALHHYINRLLRSGDAEVAEALIGLYRPLKAALSDRGGREGAAATARKLAACRDALATRAAEARATLPAARHEGFDTGVSLLQRFFADLHDYVATEATLVAPQQWRTPQDRGDTAVFVRGNDYAAAALTALRSALLVATMCWLWIQAGWISGATAVFQAVALSAILSSSANAPAAARSLFKGFVFGIVLGVICQLLVLPQMDGYVLFVAGTLPFLLVTLYLASKPALYGFATGANLAFVSILAVQPTPSFNAAATFNSVVPLLLGTLAVSATFVFVPPVIGTRWQRRRLLERLRRQTTLAARAPLPGLALQLESVNRDLFQQIVAHTPPGSDELRDLLGWALSVHETGRTLVELRRDAAEGTLPPALATAVEAAVQALADLYLDPSPHRHRHALQRVEAALAASQVEGAVPLRWKPTREHLLLLRGALLDADSVLAALADTPAPTTAPPGADDAAAR
ncbi:FUSC family protein [Xanthomonas sontii]|uniref:FUSC family protein n=1 Tax=Xanthomonas sontii TaxID=2650745 RepID=UPI0011E459C9|nr:FUSC family protein [Xanthomonas sontii]MDQ7760954.1 FUSC family protein [Xanthomonas sontii]TYD33847.1 fusaric acid resistance protein [Xanthomonas sontii]UZK06779.1 FUSC family protein [Xanthomonas sontii]